MGSDRRTFFNQLVNVGALSGLAAMLPSDALAKVESSIQGETPEVQLESGNDTTRTHTFHAHAHIFHSDTDHRLAHELGSQRLIRLPEGGGFRSQFVDGHKSNGICFKSAYMHVAGTRSSKFGYGWVTLATSVLTGLNVHGVVQADLVFAQVSTEHPLEGYVPSVTFLGTRFENLRIGGREAEPVFDLGICGPKPESDKAYVQDAGFLSRVAQQYHGDAARDAARVGQQGKVECSLVTHVAKTIPGTSFGHTIEVAGLGKVSLAKLAVDQAFHLTMVSVDSAQTGGVHFGGSGANGNTRP